MGLDSKIVGVSAGRDTSGVVDPIPSGDEGLDSRRPDSYISVLPLTALPPPNQGSYAVRMAAAHGLGLRLEQRLNQALVLHVPGALSDFERTYARADQRNYNKHGLNFTYAVVKREDFPYMLALGTPGLQVTVMRQGEAVPLLFVMEDFFARVPLELRSTLIEFIAVHEYGEAVFGDHHQASLLEFAIAQREGVLEKYLKFLSQKSLLKFRDIAVNRMIPELLREGEEVEQGGAAELAEVRLGESSSADQAAVYRDGFSWPPNLYSLYSQPDREDQYIARDKMEEWAARVTVNEQVRDHLELAASQALEAGRTMLASEGQGPQVLRRVFSAFYQTLLPLARELDNETLRADYIDAPRAAAVLQDAYQQIQNGLQNAHLALLLDTDPFFKRSFRDHLVIAATHAEWITEFGRAFTDEAKRDSYDLSQDPPLADQAEHWLNLLLDQAAQRGGNEQKVRAALAKHANMLGEVIFYYLQATRSLPADNPQLRQAWFDVFMPPLIAKVVAKKPQEIRELPDTLLNNLLSVFKAGLDESSSLSATKLRRDYGVDFASDRSVIRDPSPELQARRWVAVAEKAPGHASCEFIAQKLIQLEVKESFFIQKLKEYPPPLARALGRLLLQRNLPLDEVVVIVDQVLIVAHELGCPPEAVPLIVSERLADRLSHLAQDWFDDADVSLSDPILWDGLIRDEGLLKALSPTAQQGGVLRQSLRDVDPDWVERAQVALATSDDSPWALLALGDAHNFSSTPDEIRQRWFLQGHHNIGDFKQGMRALGHRLVFLDRPSSRWEAARWQSELRRQPRQQDFIVFTQRSLAAASAQDAVELRFMFRDFPSPLARSLFATLNRERRKGVESVLRGSSLVLQDSLIDLDQLAHISNPQSLDDWDALLSVYHALCEFSVSYNINWVSGEHLSDDLISAFLKSVDPALKQSALLALVVRGKSTAIEYLLNHMPDRDPDLRVAKELLSLPAIVSDVLTLPVLRKLAPYNSKAKEMLEARPSPSRGGTSDKKRGSVALPILPALVALGGGGTVLMQKGEPTAALQPVVEVPISSPDSVWPVVATAATMDPRVEAWTMQLENQAPELLPEWNQAVSLWMECGGSLDSLVVSQYPDLGAVLQVGGEEVVPTTSAEMPPADLTLLPGLSLSTSVSMLASG